MFQINYSFYAKIVQDHALTHYLGTRLCL